MLLLSLVLTYTSFTPFTVYANDGVEQETPYASTIIEVSMAVIKALPEGKLAIECYVDAETVTKKIGFTEITVQESSDKSSWKTVKTYENRYKYNSSDAVITLEYKGTPKKYYRVIAKAYAETATDSSSRTITSNTVTAFS